MRYPTEQTEGFIKDKQYNKVSKIEKMKNDKIKETTQGLLHDWPRREGANTNVSPNLPRYGDHTPERFKGDGILRIVILNKRGINMENI